MYIVTEHTEKETHVRGVFANRTLKNRNIQKILDSAKLGSVVHVRTGKANTILYTSRDVEVYKIKLVPQVQQAVKVKR
jgi:hypothetical protein